MIFRLVVAACLFQVGVASTPSSMPADAKRVVERLAACAHFAGEINGDGSERDKEVMATMTDLRCHTLEQDVSATRKKYADVPAVLEALDAASEL